MDPSPEQTVAFGQLAKARREALGLSAAEVARRTMARLDGARVGHQDVLKWESGDYAPKTLDKARSLDVVLEAEGALVAILTGGDLAERVTRLEEGQAGVLRQVAALEKAIRRLTRDT